MLVAAGIPELKRYSLVTCMYISQQNNVASLQLSICLEFCEFLLIFSHEYPLTARMKL